MWLKEAVKITEDTHVSFVALKLFQEPGTKLNITKDFCRNYEGFRNYVAGAGEEDQVYVFTINHNITVINKFLQYLSFIYLLSIRLSFISVVACQNLLPF